MWQVRYCPVQLRVVSPATNASDGAKPRRIATSRRQVAPRPASPDKHPEPGELAGAAPACAASLGQNVLAHDVVVKCKHRSQRTLPLVQGVLVPA